MSYYTALGFVLPIATWAAGYWLGRRAGIQRALEITKQEFAAYYRANGIRP